MIFGTGAPQVELYDGETKFGSTILLPHPNKRPYQNYLPVRTSLGPNALGEEVFTDTKFRFRVIMIYFLDSQNRDSYLTTVYKLAGWTGETQYVKFRPHDDVGRWELCKVIPSENDVVPYEGTVLADEIRIELQGTTLYPKKPNIGAIRVNPGLGLTS